MGSHLGIITSRKRSEDNFRSYAENVTSVLPVRVSLNPFVFSMYVNSCDPRLVKLN